MNTTTTTTTTIVLVLVLSSSLRLPPKAIQFLSSLARNGVTFTVARLMLAPKVKGFLRSYKGTNVQPGGTILEEVKCLLTRASADRSQRHVHS